MEKDYREAFDRVLACLDVLQPRPALVICAYTRNWPECCVCIPLMASSIWTRAKASPFGWLRPWYRFIQ